MSTFERLIVKQLIGLLMLLAGAWGALLVIGFASMVGLSLDGLAWWLEFWEHLTHKGDIWGLVFSLTLVVVGFRMILPKKWTPLEEPQHFLSNDHKTLF
jgi:hypothetical protein